MSLRKVWLFLLCLILVFSAQAEVQHALSGLRTFMEIALLVGLVDAYVFLGYLITRNLFFFILSLLLGILLLMESLFLLEGVGWKSEDIISLAGVIALVFSSVQLFVLLYFGLKKLRNPRS